MKPFKEILAVSCFYVKKLPDHLRAKNYRILSILAVDLVAVLVICFFLNKKPTIDAWLKSRLETTLINQSCFENFYLNFANSFSY